MADAAFDTQAMTHKPKAKGFDTGQAEAITDAIHTGVTGGVATKADMADVKEGLAGVLTELAKMETRLTFRIVIVRAAIGGIVITAVGWMLP